MTVKTINDVMEANASIQKHRLSDDKMLNENGRELLELCKTTNLFIVNGRVGCAPDSSFTCHTARGQSVVDYIITSADILSNVASFHIDPNNPLSDHCCVCATIKNMKQTDGADYSGSDHSRTFYKWNTHTKEQYTERINSDDMQMSLNNVIEAINESNSNDNVEGTVKSINNILLQAAEPCKVVCRDRPNNKRVRLHQSPWYDRECEIQRKIVN